MLLCVSQTQSKFVSADLAEFYNTSGIEHVVMAPLNLQSKRRAQSCVDTCKRALKKIKEGGSCASKAIDIFLLTYKNTPSKLLEHKSPAEVMFNRRIRTCLELLRPPPRLDPELEDVRTVPRKFKFNNLVYAKQYRRNSWRWVPGVISGCIGRVMYEVTIEQGRKIRSHINQLRTRVDGNNANEVAAKLDTTSKRSLPLSLLYDAWNMIEQVHNPVEGPN